MKSKEEILQKMIDEMPFTFIEPIRPYFLEAMQIYADQFIPTVKYADHKHFSTMTKEDEEGIRNAIKALDRATHKLIYGKDPEPPICNTEVRSEIISSGIPSSVTIDNALEYLKRKGWGPASIRPTSSVARLLVEYFRLNYPVDFPAELAKAIQVLRDIASPITYLQNEATKAGAQLDGMGAMGFAKNGYLLSDMAKKFIEEYDKNHEKKD